MGLVPPSCRGFVLARGAEPDRSASALVPLLCWLAWRRLRVATSRPASPLRVQPGVSFLAHVWSRSATFTTRASGSGVGGFFAYPLFGLDDSDRVQYVGQRGPHGSFDRDHLVPGCARQLGGFNDVVTTRRPGSARSSICDLGAGGLVSYPGREVVEQPLRDGQRIAVTLDGCWTGGRQPMPSPMRATDDAAAIRRHARRASCCAPTSVEAARHRRRRRRARRSGWVARCWPEAMGITVSRSARRCVVVHLHRGESTVLVEPVVVVGGRGCCARAFRRSVRGGQRQGLLGQPAGRSGRVPAEYCLRTLWRSWSPKGGGQADAARRRAAADALLERAQRGGRRSRRPRTLELGGWLVVDQCCGAAAPPRADAARAGIDRDRDRVATC